MCIVAVTTQTGGLTRVLLVTDDFVQPGDVFCETCGKGVG